MLRAGTLVVQGDGVAEVTATGARTTLGRIGRVLASIESRPSRLHEELTAAGSQGGVRRRPDLPSWRPACSPGARVVDRRAARRPDPGDVDHSRGVRGRLERHAGARRLAPGGIARPDAPAAGDRGARRDDRALRRQDRHADRAIAWRSPRSPTASERRAGRRQPLDGRLQALLRSAAMASVREGIEPMDKAIHRLLDAQRVIAAAARCGGARA